MGSSLMTFGLWCALTLPCAYELTVSQKQVVDRQERNRKETEKKLDDFLAGYATATADLAPDALVVPTFFDEYLDDAEALRAKLDAMVSDLDKHQCPDSDAQVAELRRFIADSKSRLDEFLVEAEPRHDSLRRLADRKSYPNLETDFDRIEDLGKAYALTDFLSAPELARGLARDYRQATRWCSERFEEYREYLSLSGGTENELYGRYARTAQSLQEFDLAAEQFAVVSEKKIPQLLDQAITHAESAARVRDPAPFLGEVEDLLDEALARIDVCAGFSTASDARVKGWRAARDAAKHRVDELSASLEHEIIDAMRAPEDQYIGQDKLQLRKGLQRAWKDAWPNDEVLDIRFPMRSFERVVKWTWSDSERTWRKSDISTLELTVILADGHDHALLYPAFVIHDHIQDHSSFDVRTKTTDFEPRRMLRDYLE